MSSTGGLPRGGGGANIPPSGAGIPPAPGAASGAQEAGEGVIIGGAQVNPDGTVTVNGVSVDISTQEGAAALMGAVNPEELAQIKAMLQLKEVDGPDGPILIPNDRYEPVDTTALKGALGPTTGGVGNELDQEVGKFFEQIIGINPYNENTTPEITRTLKTTYAKEFNAAVDAVTEYVENPTEENLRKATDALIELTEAFAKGESREGGRPAMNSSAGGVGSDTNIRSNPSTGFDPNINLEGIPIHEILMAVMKEHIRDGAENKRYFLEKLQMYNEMGEQLSDYLFDLTEHSRQLGVKAAASKYPEMLKTPEAVDIKQFNLDTLGADGSLVQINSTDRRHLDRSGLSNTIKDVEAMQETVRNKRQMASTAFQNFDQKTNQSYNLLSSVMKSMNEMRMGTVRNML